MSSGIAILAKNISPSTQPQSQQSPSHILLEPQPSIHSRSAKKIKYPDARHADAEHSAPAFRTPSPEPHSTAVAWVWMSTSLTSRMLTRQTLGLRPDIPRKSFEINRLLIDLAATARQIYNRLPIQCRGAKLCFLYLLRVHYFAVACNSVKPMHN